MSSIIYAPYVVHLQYLSLPNSPLWALWGYVALPYPVTLCWDFLITTVSTMPNIIALLHIWATGLVIVVCCVSVQESAWCLHSGFKSWSWRPCLTVTDVCLMCFVSYIITLPNFITCTCYDHPSGLCCCLQWSPHTSRDPHFLSEPLLWILKKVRQSLCKYHYSWCMLLALLLGLCNTHYHYHYSLAFYQFLALVP